jgi:hypothetical protein
MTVVSAAVEANGWVLALRGNWSSLIAGGGWFRPNGQPLAWNADRPDAQWRVGGVDQFPLDPGGTPRLVLNVRDAGFDRSGEAPVANGNRPRTIVATRPLRLPFQGAGVECALDEFDHGDGTRTIRFALSDRVYVNSMIVTASFLPGWRVGQAGGTVNTVTNNSTRIAPLPIFRWANEPWAYVGGTAGAPVHTGRVELIVATHHPESPANNTGNRHHACAAVQLRAFDGTTFKDFFFNSPQTSPLYADDLRCWGGLIDLSGLNPGPITVHATVYPWIGPARSTGTAHSTSETAALGPTWGTPFHLWYDPEGAIWPRKYVAIDPVGGTTTAASVVWQSSVSAANAASAGTKPANFVTACRAVATGSGGGVTLPARNGFGSHTNCGAWWEVLLPEGVSEPTGDLSGTPRSGPGYLVVRGNPGVTTPRTNCILRSGATQRSWNSLNRMKIADCRLELGTAHLFNLTVSPTTPWTTLENVDIRLKSGGTDGFAVFNNSGQTSHFNVDARNIGPTGQQLGWLFRNVSRTALMSSSSLIGAVINVRIKMPEVGDIAPSRAGSAFSSGTPSNDDLMLWNVEAYGLQNTILTPRGTTFGTDEGSFRWALVNVLAENILNAGAGEHLIVGETGASTLIDCIFEGVTMAGGRWNFHNDVEIHSSTSSGAAVRVNNSPNTTVRIGLMAHGMSSGDTITVSGFANANMNRAGVAVTVLDANRFEYTAAAAVTAATTGTGVVQFLTGAMAGQPNRTIVRHNLRHRGNVVRYSSMDRNATKHDLFNGTAVLTGGWEVLFGVGYRGNVNANRGVGSPADFQHGFYGLGSVAELEFSGSGLSSSPAYGVAWHGYVNDTTNNGPLGGTGGTPGGDYRADTAALPPFKPSRLLNRGNGAAVVDRDGRGGTRGATFDAGALGRLATVDVSTSLEPMDGVSAHAAASAGLDWVGGIAPADAVSVVAGSAAGLAVVGAVSQASGRLLRVADEAAGIRVDPE